jgi:very-short-patch-repair endonuclease
MVPALVTARRQDGMLSSEQALRAGLTRGQIEQLVRTGAWARPFTGTYLVPGAHPLLARLRAALHRRPDGIICGLSAARLYGLGALPPHIPAEPVHLLVGGASSRTSSPGLILHAGVLLGDQVRRRRGLPVTYLTRTLADLVLSWERAEAVALLDAALSDGRLRDLAAVRSQFFGRRGASSRYPWLADVDGRAESPLETRLRLLLRDAGRGPEELQYRVRDEAGRVVARADLAWPSRRLLVEADGAAYHGAPHADPEPLHRDRDRQNMLARLGWTVLRFTWADVLARPGHVVATVADLLARAA